LTPRGVRPSPQTFSLGNLDFSDVRLVGGAARDGAAPVAGAGGWGLVLGHVA
jgi:hypothetical protein